MNETQIATFLTRRYLMAQHPLGRFLLALHVDIQRMRARWMARSRSILKRSFDIALSALFLILFSPLFALIALLIWLEDGGSIFFAQTRVGQFGREFKMYKIRSMCRNAEARLKELLDQNRHKEGVTFKIKDDPRVTKVGRVLRRFSLDELPQLFNVIRGEMSLVGPRPLVLNEDEFVASWGRRRLSLRPGMTGVWQILGRTDIPFDEMVKLDYLYVTNWTLSGDLKILARTIPAIVRPQDAY